MSEQCRSKFAPTVCYTCSDDDDDDDDDVEVLIVRRTASSNNATVKPSSGIGKNCPVICPSHPIVRCIPDANVDKTDETQSNYTRKRPRSKSTKIRQTQLVVVPRTTVAVGECSSDTTVARVQFQCVADADSLGTSSLNKPAKSKRPRKDKAALAAQQDEAARALLSKRLNCPLFKTTREAVQQVVAGRLRSFLGADQQKEALFDTSDQSGVRTKNARKSHVIQLRPSDVKFLPDAPYRVTLFSNTVSLWSSSSQAFGVFAGILDEFAAVLPHTGFVPAFRSLTQIPGRDRTVLFCDTQPMSLSSLESHAAVEKICRYSPTRCTDEASAAEQNNLEEHAEECGNESQNSGLDNQNQSSSQKLLDVTASDEHDDDSSLLNNSQCDILMSPS